MSTTSENDWRAQALQNMEQADQEQIAPPHVTGHSLGMVFVKLGLMIICSLPLMFVGWSFLPAVALAGWYLFWPR